MNPSNYDEDQMERFLDGLMTEEEAADFTASVPAAELEALLAMEEQLSQSLAKLTSISTLDQGEIEREFVSSHPAVVGRPTSDLPRSSSRRRWVQIALVACLLIAVGIPVLWNLNNGPVGVHFEQRPLAQLYQETVDRGFRPNYNCEEPQRFADTFERNHGKPLALDDLPDGSKMLGLSTLGGISRSTVAMLCSVNGENVIVFVDRAGKADLETPKRLDNGSNVNIFVEEKNGLVFLEVTPLESARMIEHFRFLE